LQTNKEKMEDFIWLKFEQLWNRKFTVGLRTESVDYTIMLRPENESFGFRVDVPLTLPLISSIGSKRDELHIQSMAVLLGFCHEYSEMVKALANDISHMTTELVFVRFPVGRRMRHIVGVPPADFWCMYVAEPTCLYVRDLEREYPWLQFIPNWPSIIPTIASNVVDWTSGAPNFDRISEGVAPFAMFGKVLDHLSREEKCDVLLSVLFGETHFSNTKSEKRSCAKNNS
jgi:hypothetical protein